MTKENLVKRAYFNLLKQNFDDPTLNELIDSDSLVKFEIRPRLNSIDGNKITILIYEKHNIDDEQDIRLIRTISYSDLKQFFTLLGLQNGVKEQGKAVQGLKLSTNTYNRIYDKLVDDRLMIVLSLYKQNILMNFELDPYYKHSFELIEKSPKALKTIRPKKYLQTHIDEIKNGLMSYLQTNIQDNIVNNQKMHN